MGSASPFIGAMIGTEIMSFFICLILLAGNRLENNGQTKRGRWFNVFVLSEMVGCFSDTVSWILDGHSELTALLFGTTVCSMITTLVMLGIFISYLTVYIRERKEISGLSAVIGWTAVTIGVIATVVMSFTGDLFVFENGIFTTKPLYSVYVIVNTLYMIIGFVFVTVYRKVLNRYDKLAAYAYMVFPMLVAAVGLFIDGFDFSYPAIAISLVVLYIILHSDRMKKLEKEGTITSYKANHDELTGLNNRNAYRDRIRALKSIKENSGVIFSDLNGLKNTNDTLGHEAGDRLLIRYAQLLTGIFRINDIYRLSGDEFICIMENVPEEAFKKRSRELQDALNEEEPPLACIGAAYGRSSDIEILVRNAENSMYAEKKIIHERFPIMKR